MALVKPNFDDAVDFKPWKPSWHKVRVEKVTDFKASTGTPMLKWTYVAIAGDEMGRPCTRNTPLAGDGSGFTMRALEAIGVDPQFAARNGLDLDSLYGKELFIRTEVEEYEGEPRTRVTGFKKA